MNLANQLTMLRMGLALAMFLALMQKSVASHWAAFALFLAAIVTDWVDGYVARRTGTVSAFGKVADPIADKILVLGALIGLMRTQELAIPPWGVFLIIARELLIGGVRVLAGVNGKVLAADAWGKWKMGIQSVSVLLMLAILVFLESFPSPPAWVLRLPYHLTVLCVAAAWSSAFSYFRQSRKMLEKSWS
ncbi:MAG: CDP-diacylglycerol--glycerol-3-phosphate 3-phosphatidyltransferase [Elusimicrobia bacterium]|nr:CDP-diacylglycerol--glycerol-3-phosphate 3-phosphatidyltransferase [Elusimicrobiota bacterium]